MKHGRSQRPRGRRQDGGLATSEGRRAGRAELTCAVAATMLSWWPKGRRRRFRGAGCRSRRNPNLQEESMMKKMLLAALVLLPLVALASQRVMVNEEFTRVQG